MGLCTNRYNYFMYLWVPPACAPGGYYHGAGKKFCPARGGRTQTGLTESETSLGRFGFRFLRNRNTLQLLGSRRHVDRRLLCLVEQGLEGMTVFMFDFLPLGEQSGMPSEKFEDLGACCPGLCLLRLLEQVFHLLEHSIC